MQRDIKKYKVVRRGQKWCVRVKGTINTTDSYGWCRERNMSYHIKQYWPLALDWEETYFRDLRSWDYDFIFNEKKEALTFILGYL